MTAPWRQPRPAWTCGAALAMLLAVAPASAQLPHIDPLPWWAPADSSASLSLTAEMARFTDPKFDWRTNRLLLTVQLPAGEKARFFVRAPYLSFDTGDTPLRSRWPWVLGPDAAEDWPGEGVVDGVGQVEVGATGEMTLPLAGRLGYGVALGTPIGEDRLYPLSSSGIPVQFAVRDVVRLGPRLQWGLELGYVKHLDPSGEELDPIGFPGGAHLGQSLDWYPGRGARMGLTWDWHDREGRRSQLLGVQAWLPWTRTGAIGLRASRELQGTLDRHAAWCFAVAWRLDSLAHRPGREKPGKNRPVQNATPDAGP